MKFTEVITRDVTSNWKCVIWKDSVTHLGTGKPVKVIAKINGYEFQATFLPTGGMHMLPLNAKVIKAINHDIGDSVEVDFTTL